VLEAAFWGFAGASSLLIGAVIGARAKLSNRTIGLILGFGAGTLVSAVAFELTEDSFELGGADTVALGLALGGLAYFAGTVAIARRGGSERMGASGRNDVDASKALLLGAVLDGIPESVVIGITLIAGGEVGLPFLAAVFISNLPEAISSSQGMCQQGQRLATVLRSWAIVVAASTAAAAIGFGVLDGASDDLIGLIQAFAGGAVLTMLADTMFPEAYLYVRGEPELHRRRAPRPLLENSVGLLTTLGFAVAYLLSTLE
jgi:zinc transporter, ZIP family